MRWMLRKCLRNRYVGPDDPRAKWTADTVAAQLQADIGRSPLAFAQAPWRSTIMKFRYTPPPVSAAHGQGAAAAAAAATAAS